MQGDVVPKGYKMGQIQNFDKRQTGLYKQSFNQVGPDSYLSRLANGDQSQFDEMEAPAMRQFAGIQGNLASRFSGMGMGGRHSSGFQNTMNQAGSDFAQDLASKRNDYRRQAIQDLMGFSSDLLGQRPSERFMVEKEAKKPGFWGQLGGGVARAGGAAAGAYFGGPAGAQAGYAAGDAAAKSFGV